MWDPRKMVSKELRITNYEFFKPLVLKTVFNFPLVSNNVLPMQTQLTLVNKCGSSKVQKINRAKAGDDWKCVDAFCFGHKRSWAWRWLESSSVKRWQMCFPYHKTQSQSLFQGAGSHKSQSPINRRKHTTAGGYEYEHFPTDAKRIVCEFPHTRMMFTNISSDI